MQKRLLGILWMLAAALLGGCGVGLCLEPEACGVPIVGDTNTEPPPGEEVPLVLADFLVSTMHRDKGTQQQSLRQEQIGELPAGYHLIPDLTTDNEGVAGASVEVSVGPDTVCGDTQASIEARIADGDTANGALASWDGVLNGHAGQSTWRLVTYNGVHEVWRDERTQLIWSDELGATNWCRAAGVSGPPFGEVDGDGVCNDWLYQDQTTPFSWCVEVPGFQTPGAGNSMKGGMRLDATGTSPSVIWRLPTRWDFDQAEIDGIRFVLPSMQGSSENAWTTTVDVIDRYMAITIQLGGGGFIAVSRPTSTQRVYCVGVAL